MFTLPPTWQECRDLLTAILWFVDRAPFIYVNMGPEKGVQKIDYAQLCATLPAQLQQFLQTGVRAAWDVPFQIHGPQADWLLLPCGVLPSRPEDFVLKFNVRALHQEPAWALNHPGFAAFFPALIHVQKQQGRLGTYVWQHIWQQATGAFFYSDAWQQLHELQEFCALDMATTQWTFRQDVLVNMLTPAQQTAWGTRGAGMDPPEPPEPVVENAALRNIIIEGTIALPPMTCCKGHGVTASLFCTVCTQLYCQNCAGGSEHWGHIFKKIQ